SDSAVDPPLLTQTGGREGWWQGGGMSAVAQVKRILHVDDSAADARLVREAMREGETPDLATEIYRVGDGEEPMAFLRREGRHAAAPGPDPILRDLNLPRKDGREVLAEIKRDPSLCRIPVVVLTTSRAERGIVHAYDLHANCFVTKPFDLDDFFR